MALASTCSRQANEVSNNTLPTHKQLQLKINCGGPWKLQWRAQCMVEAWHTHSCTAANVAHAKASSAGTAYWHWRGSQQGSFTTTMLVTDDAHRIPITRSACCTCCCCFWCWCDPPVSSTGHDTSTLHMTRSPARPAERARPGPADTPATGLPRHDDTETTYHIMFFATRQNCTTKLLHSAASQASLAPPKWTPQHQQLRKKPCTCVQSSPPPDPLPACIAGTTALSSLMAPFAACCPPAGRAAWWSLPALCSQWRHSSCPHHVSPVPPTIP
jgi:hypothetical protein